MKWNHYIYLCFLKKKAIYKYLILKIKELVKATVEWICFFQTSEIHAWPFYSVIAQKD